MTRSGIIRGALAILIPVLTCAIAWSITTAHAGDPRSAGIPLGAHLAAAIATPGPTTPPPPSVSPSPPSPTPDTPSPSTSTSPGATPPKKTCDEAVKQTDPSLCQDGKDDGSAWGGPFGIFNKMGEGFTKAQAKALEWLFAFWVKPDTMTVGSDQNPTQASKEVNWLMQRLNVFTAFAAVLGLLVAAGRLAWQRRGEPAMEALGGIVTLTVVTGCIVGIVSLAAKAGDSYSEWIIKDAVSTNSGDVTGWTTIAAALTVTTNPSNWAIAILLGLIVFIAALVQLALMMVRSVMLGLLTGFMPLLAAGTVTQEGRAAFRKATSWLVAFALYKPVCATIYAFGFRELMSSDEMAQIKGMVIVVLAVLTLPALMRFVMPMVAASSGGAAGGAAMAGAAALGARMVPGFGGANGAQAPSAESAAAEHGPPGATHASPGGAQAQAPGGTAGQPPGGAPPSPPDGGSPSPATPEGGTEPPAGAPQPEGAAPTNPSAPASGAHSNVPAGSGAAAGGPAAVIEPAVRAAWNTGQQIGRSATEDPSEGSGGPHGSR